jgi:beta-galactosidase GanA
VSGLRRACLILAALAGLAQPAAAQRPPLPRIEAAGGHHALFVDGEPFLMLGAQVNNSSNYPAMLPEVWPVIDELNANTVEVPIGWQQIEPQEGKFDFSFLDALLPQARAHHVRLVLLWFGTWKNTAPAYTPDWVKLDQKRFPHMINAKGEVHYALSPHYRSTLEADKRAFVKLMEYLKANDPQNTVIMIQPENETGSYGSVRDFSPVAQKLFDGPVPQSLLKQMHKAPGTWHDVFGKDAGEFFHAWSIASYVNEIAAAGKAVKPLPMYMNAALASAFGRQDPATYSSGGPVHFVIDVYKAAAPAIDLVAPDIYVRDHAAYMAYLGFYDRPDNALFVPETGNDREFARYFFPAIGRGSIGFSPFGMDNTGYFNYPLGGKELGPETLNLFARNYRVFAPMEREWAQWALAGKTWGAAEPTDPKAEHTQVLDLGKYKLTATFGQWQFGSDKPTGNPRPTGGVAVAQIADDEYIVTGFDTRVAFSLAHPAPLESMIMLRVEEGHFDGGKWIFRRVWNGDSVDYGLNFTDREQVLRVKLASYRGTPPIPVGNPN